MKNQEIEPSEKTPESLHRSNWRITRQLTIWLLASWLLLSFVFLYFARELASFAFFDWPLSFYMAAQGLPLLFVTILGIFSLCSHRIERRNEQTGKGHHKDDFHGAK